MDCGALPPVLHGLWYLPWFPLLTDRNEAKEVDSTIKNTCLK